MKHSSSKTRHSGESAFKQALSLSKSSLFLPSENLPSHLFHPDILVIRGNIFPCTIARRAHLNSRWRSSDAPGQQLSGLLPQTLEWFVLALQTQKLKRREHPNIQKPITRAPSTPPTPAEKPGFLFKECTSTSALSEYRADTDRPLAPSPAESRGDCPSPHKRWGSRSERCGLGMKRPTAAPPC